MQIELIARLRCACNLAIEIPFGSGPMPSLPMGGQFEIKNLPLGWQRGPQGSLHCPAHPPRLVEPVAVMPAIVVNNGKAH
jgi:hypothetical protein